MCPLDASLRPLMIAIGAKRTGTKKIDNNE
jgi:hypothetical protein